MHAGHSSARLLLQHLRGGDKSITTSLRPDVFIQLVPGQSELHIKSPPPKKIKNLDIHFLKINIQKLHLIWT